LQWAGAWLLANWFYWQNTVLFLQVQLQPGARTDQIVGEHGECLKIRITAPPVDGKANKHLIKFLAHCFDVPQQRVTVEKGELNRMKLIRIDTPNNIQILKDMSTNKNENHTGK
jgi:uncharacterized protein (TIGR00251 family)